MALRKTTLHLAYNKDYDLCRYYIRFYFNIFIYISMKKGMTVKCICKFFFFKTKFSFQAMKIRVSRNWAMLVTVLQLSQMVVGVYINIYSMWIKRNMIWMFYYSLIFILQNINLDKSHTWLFFNEQRNLHENKYMHA